MDAEATDRTAFLDGRVLVDQPRAGFRSGLDAVLLAAAAASLPGARALEAGCGAGAALLSLAVRRPDLSLTGLERDAAAAALCARNIALNGVQDRVCVLAGDVLRATGRPGGFDVVFANPPFFDDAAAIRPPAPARRAAHVADAPLERWVRALCACAAPKGRVLILHRAERLGEILAALAGRAGEASVYPVRPRADQPAKRVLVAARKASRAPVRLLKGLDLHPLGGEARFTPEAAAIFSGGPLSLSAA